LRGDRQVSRLVLDAYFQAWKTIRADLEVVTGQLAEARARGEEPSAAWLYQEERLSTLKGQVEAEVAQIATRLGPFLTGEQARWVARATEDAAALLGVAAGGAAAGRAGTVTAEFVRLNPGAVEGVIGFLSDGSPLQALLNELGPDAAERVGNALTQGVILGQSPAEIARLARRALGGNAARAMLISRDAVIRSYQDTAHQNYLANAATVAGWRWWASLGPRACASCISLHGTLHPLTERLREHPGGRCFPAGTWASGPPPVAATSRYYRGHLIRIRTAAGHFLACTPEHPVLTSRGWLPARLLHEGADVVSSALGERTAPEIRPDDYQVPTLIEEVAGTLRGAGGVPSRGVPGAAVQLDRDGSGREVDVVDPDRPLWHRGDAAGGEPVLQQLLPGRTRPLALARQPFGRLGTGQLHGPWQRPPAGRGVGGGEALPLFFGGEGRGQQSVRFPGRSRRDAGRQQPRPDDGAGCPVCAGEAVLRLARQVAGDDLRVRQARAGAHRGAQFPTSEDAVGFGVPHHPASLQDLRETLASQVVAPAQYLHALARSVVLDRVLEVGVTRFSGQVYNLQTPTQWYIANGVVVHNCTQVPVVKGEPEPAFQTGPEWFAEQPVSVQRAIVGPAKLGALQAGDIAPEDLSIRRRSRRWGAHFTEATYAEALASADARRARGGTA
jgi:hypothetical protein